eukprot:scpid87169/ scgid31128/ 
MRCLSGHRSPQTLARHQLYCADAKPAVIKLPEPGETLTFTENKRRMKMPYIIYADTESVLAPSSGQHGANTVRNAEHEPCGIAYIVVRSDGEVTRRFLYRGEFTLHRYKCCSLLFFMHASVQSLYVVEVNHHTVTTSYV